MKLSFSIYLFDTTSDTLKLVIDRISSDFTVVLHFSKRQKICTNTSLTYVLKNSNATATLYKTKRTIDHHHLEKSASLQLDCAPISSLYLQRGSLSSWTLAGVGTRREAQVCRERKPHEDETPREARGVRARGVRSGWH